jgi:putative transposase
LIYHVLNRANARLKIFSGRNDYEEFVQAMNESLEHVPIRVLSWCLMPDHWHLVLWPRREGELSEFMRRLSVTHTRRWHARRHSSGSGHLYQGRYRSFPVEPDAHLVEVCRYVEGNAVRAAMVRKAVDWPWSSVADRAGGRARDGKSSVAAKAGAIERPALSDWPIETPRGWPARVDAKIDSAELAELRKSVQRGTPFGSLEWQAKIARRLHLESTMRPRGRPRKYPLPADRGPAVKISRQPLTGRK